MFRGVSLNLSALSLEDMGSAQRLMPAGRTCLLCPTILSRRNRGEVCQFGHRDYKVLTVPKGTAPDMAHIAVLVGQEYGVNAHLLSSSAQRNEHVALSQDVFMYLLAVDRHLSHIEVRDVIGAPSKNLVKNAIGRVRSLVETDVATQVHVSRIREQYK